MFKSTLPKITFILLCLIPLTACAPPLTASLPAQNNQAPVESAPASTGNSDTAPISLPARTSPSTTTDTTTETSTNTNPVTNCPTDNFIQVQADPANSEYPTPSLTLTCTDTEIIITTNNIPNFEFVPKTPNPLTAQNFTYRIPLNPVQADTPTDVPLVGAIGVTTTGIVIFGPTEAPRDGSRDPYLDDILDYCNGHTADGGIYHFHASPNCFLEDFNGQLGMIVGYAFDGYPILAPVICADTGPGTFPGEIICNNTIEVQSSWQLTNPNVSNSWEQHSYMAGSGDLDQCNGMTFEDGSYAYFVTETFPYYLGCYRGVVDTSNLLPGQGNNQTTQNNAQPQNNQPPQGQQPAAPDFAAAAAQLGISEQALREALGEPPPNFALAAQKLGISEQALRAALGIP